VFLLVAYKSRPCSSHFRLVGVLVRAACLHFAFISLSLAAYPVNYGQHSVHNTNRAALRWRPVSGHNEELAST